MTLVLARIQQYLEKLDNWAIEGGTHLSKEYHFPTFPEAVAFLNRVAQCAEEQHHHPSILLDGTLLRLTLTTHEEHGLSEKDFMLAQAIDALDKQPEEKAP